MRGLLIGLIAALMASASIPAWSSTPTTNYGWLMPTVGADSNAWGTDLNNDLAGIDSVVFGMCPKTGCTFTGALIGATFDIATPTSTNVTMTGVLASGVLTASSVSGTIVPGYSLAGAGVTAGTTVSYQLTGTTGGAGTYQTSGTQSIASEAMTAFSATPGALRLRGNAAIGYGLLQLTDSTGATEWGNFKFSPNTGGTDTGPAAWNGGTFTFGGGITDNGALSVSGNSTIGGNQTTTGTTYFGGASFYASPNGGQPLLAFGANTGIEFDNAGVLVLFNGGFGNNVFLDASGNWHVTGAVLAGNGLTVSGPVTLPAGSVTGSEVASATITGSNIASGAVTNAEHANMAASTIKGNATGSAAAPQDLSPSQASAMLPGVARAWAQFSGSLSNGTVTIWKGMNVASVTRNAAGNYSVAFSSAIQDNSYAPLVTCINNGSNFNISTSVGNGTVQTGFFVVQSVNSGGTGVDCSDYSIVVFD